MHSTRRPGVDPDGPLVVTSTPVDDVQDLLGVLADDPDRFAWVRRSEGLVGWGVAARYSVTGKERFSRAHRWWTRLCEESSVCDEVQRPGSGPVAFGSFGFESEPVASVMLVPRVVVGLRDGKSWVTTVRRAGEAAGDPVELAVRSAAVDRGPGQAQWLEDPERVARWRDAVATAVGRITAGELDKVVLARDVFVRAERPIDVGLLLERLASQYSECWAFSVAGLVGATPELLVRREGDLVSSRVLAGTVRSDGDSGEAGRLAAELLGSGKDLEEHEYAVASVAAALAAHCTDLDVPEHPSILKLANVQHLATDVTGLLATQTPVLALAASLHPTAAVCGTPTERAHALIGSLEAMDRDRYAGPVGWMDARGDGEFGIALRCGQIDPDDARSIRLFSGCGIVAGSRPADEVVESEAKLQPMKLALGQP